MSEEVMTEDNMMERIIFYAHQSEGEIADEA